MAERYGFSVGESCKKDQGTVKDWRDIQAGSEVAVCLQCSISAAKHAKHCGWVPSCVHGWKHLQNKVQTADGAVPAVQRRPTGRQAPHARRHALGLDDRTILRTMPFPLARWQQTNRWLPFHDYSASMFIQLLATLLRNDILALSQRHDSMSQRQPSQGDHLAGGLSSTVDCLCVRLVRALALGCSCLSFTKRREAESAHDVAAKSAGRSARRAAQVLAELLHAPRCGEILEVAHMQACKPGWDCVTVMRVWSL